MASKPKSDEAAPETPGNGQTPPRFARLKRWAHDWQEIGHIAIFLAGALAAVTLSRLFGENAGQTPLSFIADLGQLAAATSLCALLAWLIKRALVGDLTDGEVRAGVHHVRTNTTQAPGFRYLLALDALASLGAYLAVVLTWSVLY